MVMLLISCGAVDVAFPSHAQLRFDSLLNPFKPNGISHSYDLNHSITVLRVVGGNFQFYSNFNRTFC